MLEPRHMSERRAESEHHPVRGPRPVSQSVTEAAGTFGAEPPTPEDIAGTVGAQVVLPDDSAAAAGAKGVYPTLDENTLLRDAGYVQLGLDPNDPSGELTDPDAPPITPPEGGNGGEPATAPPINRDVPYVSQSGATLHCTMGNWEGEPTSYAYQWKLDGGDVGDGSAAYAVQSGDAGKSATCVVTATNAAGSTTAPPSNAVVVA